MPNQGYVSRWNEPLQLKTDMQMDRQTGKQTGYKYIYIYIYIYICVPGPEAPPIPMPMLLPHPPRGAGGWDPKQCFLAATHSVSIEVLLAAGLGHLGLST